MEKYVQTNLFAAPEKHIKPIQCQSVTPSIGYPSRIRLIVMDTFIFEFEVTSINPPHLRFKDAWYQHSKTKERVDDCIVSGWLRGTKNTKGAYSVAYGILRDRISRINKARKE